MAFKADQREKILDAALRLFVEQGYDRTTMREIAAAADLSTGALYVYFRTKAAILDAVCREEWRVERAALRETLAVTAPGEDRIALGLRTGYGRYLSTSLATRQQRERLKLMLLYEATREPRFAETVRAGYQEWRALVRSLVVTEQEAGRLRADADPDALTDLLIALPDGLEMAELLGGRALDWSGIVSILIQLLNAGLVPATEQKSPDRSAADRGDDDS